MTLSPGHDPFETSRERTRDQVGLLRDASRSSLIVDTDDPADFGFICDSEHLLLPPAGQDGSTDVDPVDQLREYFARRSEDFDDVPEQPDQPRAGLTRRFRVPGRRERV